jgi:phosphoglucomutase
VDSVEDYAALMQSEFDFGLIKTRLFSRPDFSFAFDAMSGVAGPYARRIFVDLLGACEASVMNCVPSPDFDNGHPDPNLTYAPDLVKRMGLNSLGQPLLEADVTACPVLGAAADGDADRNMILGRRFFVTPSDSLAILAAHSGAIPSIARRGGLKAVARSMPTSSAVDAVAAALGLQLFEVPTGWKFFGNLMDAGLLHGLGARGRLTSDPAVAPTLTPLLCGEESFGTGSDHVREKDGLWAILAWLSVLADANPDATKPLVHVGDVVRAHWRRFGRCYYTRYDYEGVESPAAEGMMAHLRAMAADGAAVAALAFEAGQAAPIRVSTFDDFSYTDPIDAAVSAKQGVRVILADGARVIFRLSGTGSSGATIRMYLERPMPAAEVAALADSGVAMPSTADYMAPLVQFALELSQLQTRTGRDAPTVIT